MISPKILFIEKRISSGVEFIQKCAIFMRESGEGGKVSMDAVSILFPFLNLPHGGSNNRRKRRFNLLFEKRNIKKRLTMDLISVE